MSYYSQAVVGRLDVMARARPIAERLTDSALAPALRHRLEQAMKIREFASRKLGLPSNDSYRTYTDIEQPYVVWNVVATPEFSLKPRTSCFLFVGCVSYRGYYAQADAEAFASALREDGYDVFVSGVPAYSTLGWFDDPVLNTFIHYPDAELARLIFHELAHQIAYVKDDSTFNESFAVAVEEEGTRRWMEKNTSASERQAYVTSRARRSDFVGLLLRYRESLERLYRQPQSADARRLGKVRLFAALNSDYNALKAERWAGWPGYDRWFEAGINNAHLASVATYERRVPAFRALVASHGGDMSKFFGNVKTLAKLDKDARDAALEATLR